MTPSDPPSPPPSETRYPWLAPVAAWVAFAAAYGAYLVIFLPLLPAEGSHLGHDYKLHLPNLMAGYFHFLANGPLSIPWFNPGQCAGVPFVADLNVAYFSLPQWLTFVVDPVHSIRWTFAVFAALGGIGFVLLLRRRFHASWDVAIAAGALFLFNGFFAYRMAIGHLTFHAFALTPWVALLLLAPDAKADNAPTRTAKRLLAVVGCAVMFAYMFQSGMVHGVLPATLAVAMILLVHGYLRGYSAAPWILLAGAGVLSILMSAQRLVASVAFLENFPRSAYKLPGFENLLEAAYFAFQGVFLRTDADAAWAALANRQWSMRLHEWEFGVGPVAAIAIATGLAAIAVRWAWHGPKRPIGRTIGLAAAIAACTAFVLLLNWYQPSWNAFQKSVPIFSSASNQLRWFAAFIPVAVLFAALALQAPVADRRARLAAASAVILGTVLWNAAADKSYYLDPSGGYDGTLAIASWETVRSAEDIPPVVEIAARQAPDAFLYRQSARNCYQPMFGYRLEEFIVGPLRAGSAFDEVAPGQINLKNPACYLFPDENGCRPGGHFTTDQKQAAFRFVQYQNFAFARSGLQKAADAVNLVTLITAIASAAAAAVYLLVRRIRRGRPGVQGGNALGRRTDGIAARNVGKREKRSPTPRIDVSVPTPPSAPPAWSCRGGSSAC